MLWEGLSPFIKCTAGQYTTALQLKRLGEVGKGLVTQEGQRNSYEESV